MSRIRQEVASVQFQADGRQASATMQALQRVAEGLNKDINTVQEQIKSLGDVPPDHKGLLDYQHHLRELNSDLKDVNATMRDYMRGVKAAGELWRRHGIGDIDSLSIKAIKAGQNGLRKRMENLQPGDPKDAETMRAYQAVIDEADIVVKRFKADAANMVKTLRDGGVVSEQALRKTISAVKDLMESEQRGTSEYREFSQQFDFLTAKTVEMAAANRRLKGEIVDAGDARREALKLTQEGVEASRREREAADAVIAGLKQEIADQQALRRFHEQQMEDTAQEMHHQERLIELQQHKRDEAEKNFRMIEELNRESAKAYREQANAASEQAEQLEANARKEDQIAGERHEHYQQTLQDIENISQQLKVLNEQQSAKSTVEITEAQANYTKKVQERADAERSLRDVQNRSYNDDPHIKQLNEEIDKLEELITVSAKYKKQFAKMSDEKFESGYMGKTGIGEDQRNSVWGASDYLKKAYYDKFKSDFHKLDIVKPGDHGYEENVAAAERVANGIVQNAQENLRRAIFREIEDGKWTSSSMEKDIELFRRKMQNAAREAGKGNLKDDPEYNSYKYIVAQMEKYLEVAKQVEAERVKIANNEPFLELARSKDSLSDDPQEGLRWQQDRRKMEAVTMYRDADNRKNEDERIATEKFNKAVDEETEALRILNEEKRKGTQANKEAIKITEEEEKAVAKLLAAKEAEKKIDQEKTRNANLREGRDSRNEVLKEYGLTVKDVTDETKLQAAADAAVKKEEEARLEIAKKELEVRKEIYQEALKDNDLMKRKAVRNNDFAEELGEYLGFDPKEKGALADMNQALVDLSQGDSEDKADFKEGMGMTVAQAMKQLDQHIQAIVKERIEKGMDISEFAEMENKDSDEHPISELIKPYVDDVEREMNEYVNEKIEQLEEFSHLLNAEGEDRDSKVTAAKRDLVSMSGQGDGVTWDAAIQKSDELIRRYEEQMEAGKKILAGKEAQERKTEEQIEAESRLSQKVDELSKVYDSAAAFDRRHKGNAYKFDENASAKDIFDKMDSVRGSFSTVAMERQNGLRDYLDNIVKTVPDAKEKIAALKAEILQMTGGGEPLWLRDFDMAMKKASIPELQKQTEEIMAEVNATRQKTAAQQESAHATESSTQSEQEAADIAKKRQELEAQKAEKIRESKQAEEDYTAAQEKADKAQMDANQKRVESIALDQKAVDLEQKVTNADSDRAKALEKIDEETSRHLATLDQLSDKREKQQKDIADVDRATLQSEQQIADAEGRKAQAQELTIERLEESKKRLEEYNRTHPDDAEWEENERIIAQVSKRLEEVKQKSSELRGEWMTLDDAMTLAGKVGTSDFVTTDAEMKRATDALQRQRESLVSLIHQKEADKMATDAERESLTQLDAALAKIKTGFSGADDVMQRFKNTVDGGKTASEELAKSLEEQLASKTSDWDEQIEEATNWVKQYEQAVKKDKEIIASIEEDIDRFEKKLKSWNPLQQIVNKTRGNKAYIEELKDNLEGDGTDSNIGWKNGLKQDEEDLAYWKAKLDFYKQQKAEVLGLTSVEEKLKETRRMTREEMQEGVKILEAEAFTTDRTTESGQKRWEELRQTIERMNAKIKEFGGEWMTLADAEKLAASAGKEGFRGSAKELQMADQALQRAAASAKKGTPEWERYRQELERIKVEMQNMGITSERMHDILDNPAAARNLNELKEAVKRARAELTLMEDTIGDTSDEYAEMAKQTKNAEQRMKELESMSKGSASSFEKAWMRLKTYVTFYVGAAAAMQRLMSTMGDLMDLSDKMGEVRKTTGLTADEVGRLSDNLSKMDVRTPLTSLLEISVAAGQLGLKSTEDIQGFTEAANKMMIALPEMGNEAATEIMRVAIATGEVEKIRKQMQEGVIEGSSATAVAMEKIASTIDRLRASSASTAPEITDFVKRVGAVGAQSGISIDQVAALGSTVSSLGMRVEMSATALSRMIPAIKNNAFAVSKAIGVTPDTLRNLFDTGRAMEAILLIFQHIKDQNMDENSIEKMLGLGGMQEVMKELNQMGARAGIVFAGLSQNVDELRRQLGVANQAYEENIAIQQEFNKMNETTAAKWERLKNQIEESFVGDRPQRILGLIIDFLRGIVNFLTGDNGISAGLRTIMVYLALVRLQLASIAKGALVSIGGGLKNILIWLGLIEGKMTKLQWGNIFTAIAGAVWYAYVAFKDLKSAVDKASESLGNAKIEVSKAQEQFEGYWKKLEETSDALRQARKSHEQLAAEVENLRGSTDKSASATENLRKKEDELKRSEDEVTKASGNHKAAISQLNSIYGKYLGFILTEANYSNLAAAAHDKVTAAIEREMLAKQKQAAIGEVDSNYTSNIASEYGKLNERMVKQGLNRSQASEALSSLQKFLRENISYDSATNKAVVSKAVKDQLKKSNLNIDKATSSEIVALWYDNYLKNTFNLGDNARRKITGVFKSSKYDEGWANEYSPFGTNLRGGYAEQYIARERERGAVSAVYDVDINRASGEETKASWQLLSRLEREAKNAKTRILDKKTSDKDRNAAYISLANALEGLENRINELNPKQDAETITRLRNMAKSLRAEGINIKKLTEARREIHSTLFDRATFDENAIKDVGDKNPWGSNQPADSTDWKNMSAEALVQRRKQMNDFVNAIQTDSDVSAVLAEDAALKKAIEKGMSSDMRTVIEWYNTERLKIQDELHARHLTSTGDWQDPKKERARRKRLQEEWSYYLNELDAFYIERKSRIQEAGNDEGISEAEVQQRMLANESEWRQRRAELQLLYADKAKKVTKDEQDAIFDIISERTNDDVSYVKKSIEGTISFMKKIGEKSPSEYKNALGLLDKGQKQDFLRQQQAIHKQMKAIEDIIDKERPFNGITKNLRENMVTMGLLTADMTKERNKLMREGADMADFNARQAAEELRRTTFLLGEAENAYTTDIQQVMKRMAKSGMTAWADELRNNEQGQEAMMAQLRSTYDAIQEAIKKEASQLKKQAEIMWNNILLPGGDGKTTLKQMVDQTVAQMGIDQGRVSRANSLIGAGQASERVADKLAIKQMQLQLAMQEHYYNLMKKQGDAHVRVLREQAKAAKERGEIEKATRLELDAQHAEMSLNLATAKEETDLAKQREEIIARTEESQNRLYRSLKEWSDLLASSLQSVFEASNAGNAEYNNEKAKLDLTGKGGPGAGTYIVIDNEGTSDAKAHYEYLDEREALERQHEIEQQNAQAEAWKKVMDDVNQRMNDMITDQLNAMLQNQSIDANTQALNTLTGAINALTGTIGGQTGDGYTRNAEGFAVDGSGQVVTPVQPTGQTNGDVSTWKPSWQMTDEEKKHAKSNIDEMTGFYTDRTIEGQKQINDAVANMPNISKPASQMTDEEIDLAIEKENRLIDGKIDADSRLTDSKIQNDKKEVKSEQQADKQITSSSQSAFAKMTQAANLYGIAYQVMQNDNMSAAQKFGMVAIQAAGNSAITALTVNFAETTAQTASDTPSVLSKLYKQLGWGAIPVFAAFTGLLGGLMGLAASKIAKSKSQIAQATGASVGAGRMATGMLTYAEGNVNEFTNPSTLVPGRQYNVDAADGKTYRARYMGNNPRTHITNGPEFHLSGEKGREMIIDAGTTRQITMNETEIWRAIQTLSAGGRIQSTRRRVGGRGMKAFADGNVDEFDGAMEVGEGGMSPEQMAAFQTSLDRNNELLERALTQGIHAKFDVYGKGGLIDSYDKGKKNISRYGEKY